MTASESSRNPSRSTVEQKRRRLARMLQERNRQTRSPHWPLSYGEQAIWFMHEFAPEDATFNIGEALVLRGPLDLAAMHRAVRRLAERHRLLCSRIATDDAGDPYHTELPTDRLTARDVDATGWHRQDLTDRLGAEIDRPFDLSSEPPIRITFYRTGPEEHIGLLSLHHVVGDFWTLVIVVRDILELYRAEVAGTEPDLPVMSRDYADFAREQRELLAGEATSDLWQYWEETLSGEIPVLHLPTDRPRPPKRTFNGALQGFDLGVERATRLRDLTRQTGATAYQILLAAFAVFLHQHSGQTDLMIGAPMTGRLDADWAPAVGYFDNPLPVRIEVDQDSAFRDLVERVRTAATGAFAHQALPFSMLVERLQPDRDPSRSPLFDVMFVLRRAQLAEMSQLAGMGMGGSSRGMPITPEVDAVSMELPRAVSQYDLTLSIAETAAGLEGSWEYNRDLFDPGTIDRFTDRFTTLLDRLLDSPGSAVGELSALPDEELRWLSESYNDTGGPLPADPRLHGGFVEMARHRPDATAVLAPEIRLSYADLDRRSDTIASWLQDQDVASDELVAICMRKGWEEVAATIGICKAGAAYLPVDADLPTRRITELLRLGEVRQVLVQAETRDAVPSEYTGQVHVVDEQTLADRSGTPQAVPVDPHRLAYVIFTSGSTGTPKGVAIDHLGATNTIQDINARIGVGPTDRVLALSALSFDLSVYDIFGTLAAGAAIVLPDPARAKDPAHWLDRVNTEQVTIWNSVPALAQLVVDQAESEDPRALTDVRVAMLSGDWIPLSLPDQLRDASPGMTVLGLGGATEASIWSICYPIGEVDLRWSSIPYGRPLTNQRLYVLDEAGRVCPPGVPGHIHIGGVGLAHGYWRDEQRTNESFIQHSAFGRLYRTGDQGRFTPDGLIEFLGRQDRQVKIRGYRIELGDVEAGLREQPNIRDAMVIAVGEREQRRLVGFVLTDHPESAEAAKQGCADRLPAYMIPGLVLGLSEFPLTSNGKVDHDALIALASARKSVGDGLDISPADDRQALLCKALADVLAVSTVGPEDNFFDLGGDSVGAIRLCARIRRQGLELVPAQVFSNPTPIGMAAVATVSVASVGESTTSGVPELETNRGYGLAPMQQTMLMHGVTGRSAELYCEQVRVELRGTVDIDTLRQAWQAVVNRHAALRARFDFDSEGRPVQWFDPSHQVVIDLVDLRTYPEERRLVELDAVLADDRSRGIDCLHDPLLRWTLVRLAEDSYELVWTHHHLLLDGWSLSLVLEDVVRWYHALRDGIEPPVGEPARYTEYLAWLDAQRAARTEQDKDFWTAELAGLEQPTRLPAESFAPTGDFVHAEIELRLSEQQTSDLTSRAAELGVTVNTLIQGAWGLELSRLAGDLDVVFGVTTSGRPAEVDQVDTMVGLFINTVPLRLSVAPSMAVGEWLQEVQQRQVGASAHENSLLADVERWSGVERSPGRMALFDSVLVYENYPNAERLGGRNSELAFENVRFSEVTETPFMLYILPGRELTFRASYDGSKWSACWMDRILRDVRDTVLSLAADSQRPVGRALALATAQEGRALLDGGALPEPARPIVDRIVEHARTRPTALALEYDDQRMDYRTLVSEAYRIAGMLRARGVGPDDLVAVALPRGADMVVSVLGVLFAGAAYVPLNPDEKDARTNDVLTEAEPVALVTRSEYARGAIARQPMVLLDQPVEAVALEAPQRVHDRNLAYVIFTSGSTGRPNGVAVDRAAVDQFVTAARDYYRVTANDRILQFAPLQFDASVEELFVTLATGAALVIRDEEMTASIPAFLRKCESLRITVLDLPTAFWHELADFVVSEPGSLPAGIHTIIIGGEEVLSNRLAQWRRTVGSGPRVVNTYGPTEATVVAIGATLSGE